MAHAKLHASFEIFNDICTQGYRLRLMLQSQKTFIDGARAHGMKYGDKELLSDLDAIESCHAGFQECSERLETLAERMAYERVSSGQ